nr:hypothetical protein [Tanacetum cinerariifolium]
MASAIIYLAYNQKFNFSKYIFDHMVKSLKGGVKFYLFLRFLQVFLDKQVEGMARHKELYIISSYTKKIFANMRRIGIGFSRVITPLFDTMMVQAPADMGDIPRKEAETFHDESADVDHVPTPSSDPLPSGEDSSILNELIVLCTSLQEQILDLQEAKDAQAKEITALKKKVTKLTKWKKSRSRGLKRLKKFGLVRRGKSLMEKDGLGAQDDDKGKAKIIEPEVPLKKKDQMRIDKEYVEKERLLVELIEKKKKHFAALRAQEKRSKPPTKTQMKSQMSTYLRHMGGYKQSHLKGKSFDNIKELFDREMRKVNDFVTMDSEAQKSSEKEAQESSTKRTAEHLESDISKKQKVDENVKPVVDDSEELRKCIETVPDDGDEKIFKNFKREDLEVLWAIVKDRFKKEKPVDYMDNILFRTLKTKFKHHVEDTIWNYQQGLAKVKNWKLFKSCGVYCITMQSIIYYLVVEKVYPLTRNTLHQLWSEVRLQEDYDVEIAYDLLRFIRKQLMEGYTPQ